MGMISEIPIYYAGPKEGISKCLKDAETNATFFDKFKPGYFMYIGPGSEKTWNFDQYPDNPRSIRYCGELKRVYFDASAGSLKLLMDLTSSANVLEKKESERQ